MRRSVCWRGWRATMPGGVGEAVGSDRFIDAARRFTWRFFLICQITGADEPSSSLRTKHVDGEIGDLLWP